MPSTPLKNLVYRFLLPLKAPPCPKNPIQSVTGHSLTDEASLVHLLRRHHVQHAAVRIDRENDASTVLTSAGTDTFHLSASSLFRVASITKMASAMVTFALAEQGLLDFEAPLSVLLPFLPDRYPFTSIHLTHLLSHTSGIQDPPNLESCLENGVPLPDFLSSCAVSEPGSSFHYSNLGFGLLGCIWESALSQSAASVMKQFLLLPLKMNGASLDASSLDPEAIVPIYRILPFHPAHPLRITPLGSRPLSSPDPLKHYGHTAGSLYTDVDSLIRLLSCIRHEGVPLLHSAEWVRLMKKQHAFYGRLSPTLSYGLGLLRIDDASLSDSPIFGHQGFAYGCADGAFWEEKTGNTLIFLNGGCSEARTGRLGLANRDFLHWAFRKELPSWA